MTLHSPQTMGFSRIPIDQLSGVPIICEKFKALDLSHTVAASPDISRAKVTELYAKYLGLPLVVMDKRQTEEGTVKVHGVIGDVKDKDVVFFDDEIITGKKILASTDAVIERGANKVYAGCAYGTLAPGAVDEVLIPVAAFDHYGHYSIARPLTGPQGPSLFGCRFICSRY